MRKMIAVCLLALTLTGCEKSSVDIYAKGKMNGHDVLIRIRSNTRFVESIYDCNVIHDPECAKCDSIAKISNIEL